MKTGKAQNPVAFRILFLEDDPQDVSLMRHELDNAELKYTYKQVSTKKDFLDALITFQPDIVLADYSMPSFNGMHAFRLFKEKNLFIPFILVTGSLSEELTMECLSEGVDDFILKSSFKRLPQVVIRNIEIKKAEMERKKLHGELEKSKEQLKLLNEKAEKAKAYEMLSNREHEILCLIAAGSSIKEIASQLTLSPATVATYRARILEKLELKSNVDLTRYAMRNKLID